MPKKKPNPVTPAEVRKRLLDRGHDYTSWAKQHGYSQQMVSHTVRRFIGSSCEPRGKKTYRILSQLKQELNFTT